MSSQHTQPPCTLKSVRQHISPLLRANTRTPKPQGLCYSGQGRGSTRHPAHPDPRARRLLRGSQPFLHGPLRAPRTRDPAWQTKGEETPELGGECAQHRVSRPSRGRHPRPPSPGLCALKEPGRPACSCPHSTQTPAERLAGEITTSYTGAGFPRRGGPRQDECRQTDRAAQRPPAAGVAKRQRRTHSPGEQRRPGFPPPETPRHAAEPPVGKHRVRSRKRHISQPQTQTQKTNYRPPKPPLRQRSARRRFSGAGVSVPAPENCPSWTLCAARLREHP